MDEFKNSDGPEITASMILTGMEFLPKISVKLINFISRNFLPGLFFLNFLTYNHTLNWGEDRGDRPPLETGV